MTKLNSSELREQIESAGIQYLPAEQVFYKTFPYKVELRPKYRGKGLGGVSGKRSCQIDIANPEKARQELAAFNDRIEMILSNVEYRKEVKEFVARLPKVEYKTRMGGDNNLFYFRDPDLVLLLVDRYHDVINNVTGPINEIHADKIGERNVLMREKLYHNKFRYYLEFERSLDFVTQTAPRLMEVLQEMEHGTWREHKLTSIMKFYEAHGTLQSVHSSPGVTPRPVSTSSQVGSGNPILTAAWHAGTMEFPPRAVAIYLTDPQDYVYLKLLTAEHVKSSHELVLFDELT